MTHGDDLDKIILQNSVEKTFQVNIKGAKVKINSTLFANVNLCKSLKDWITCFTLIGRYDLAKGKDMMKVIYCLLSDATIINTINSNKIDIDLYNPFLESFLRLDTVYENKLDIKLKSFGVCDMIVVIDCRNMADYKIYEIYNVSLLKEHYDKSTVRFDKLIEDMGICVSFRGNIKNIKKDYKCLSSENIAFLKYQSLLRMENYVNYDIKLEKRLQRVYNEFNTIYKYR